MATAELMVERGEFRNELFTDYSKPANRAAMEAALLKVRSQLGREYPLLIGSERVTTGGKITSTNPSRPSEVIGIFSAAEAEHVNKAVDAAHKAFESWRHVPAADRAAVLFRTADLLRERKQEMNAWICYEAGKTWPEADADTAETIDFCEFYGREMLRLAGPQPLTPMKGEKNFLLYIPLGVGAIVPPWNFPCAIMAGLVMASVVTGNTVVLKPSSDTPTVAHKFLELLFEAGAPAGVVNCLVGRGGVVGDSLVAHPKTRFIGFTGSKEVGLHIQEVASKTQPGQVWIKRTVLEMGGKDAIVVDDEADIDAAVDGVAASAFGYQGQKCSACSRAIVAEKVYDAFLARLVDRTRKIKVGAADDPANYMGPVINQGAKKTILEYIEVGKKEGRVVTGGGAASGEGFFIEPTIIADVAPRARIAQEEIFGPVLAVIKAKDFNHALEIANDSEFGLTGAVYSRNQEKLRRAADSFHVGNLYFNRKCTGAMVGAHPFGGFNMSGTDSKTGGKDYLLLFLQAKTIAEKL
ncbi:MAG TPA: L-glutamate gamma-semialdehyde dehydrogenase [Candidatus Acidoferrales bacterium]|nr:L-glutamate gamma-semialdehyde dehydrogenase [Candidatus Acidoferrales bacterium]